MTQSPSMPYPDYDVLSKRDSPSWNPITRRVIAARLDKVPERRFFDERLWAVLEAACARLIPQPDRTHPIPIPIAPWIDAKLAEDIGDGYRFADLPVQQTAWRQGLDGLDREARRCHGQGFAELD